jgi:transposase InsO family protein
MYPAIPCTKVKYELWQAARIQGNRAGDRQLKQLDFCSSGLYPFGVAPIIAGAVYSYRSKILVRRKVYGMENNRTKEVIAFERYKIITPILSAMENNADNGKIGFLKSEACGLAGISRKTLDRWLNRYAQNGLDGLKYQPGTDAFKKLIPGEMVKEAILLRREVPTRSIPQLIEILEMEGKAPKGFLKRSTLQDRLREAGYSTAQMKLYQQPGIAARRFARLERNDMWQADIKHCGYIKYGGKPRELYFVGFIDDATRYIINGEFYHDFDQSIVEDSLRKGILKSGLPRRLYFDNGKQFNNKWMQRACAILDIKLIFAAPYSP